MFKLVVNSPNESKEYKFDSSRIVIGQKNAPGVDLGLEGPRIYKEHIVIELRDGVYHVVNIANDPFATLNGEPFGRRKLQTNDILAIDIYSLRFDTITSEAPPVSEEKLSRILDNAIQSKTVQTGAESSLEALEKELQELEDMSYDSLHAEFHEIEPEHESIEMDEIEALVREVEALEWEEVQAISNYGDKPSAAMPASTGKVLSPYLTGTTTENTPTSSKPSTAAPIEKPAVTFSKSYTSYRKELEKEEIDKRPPPPPEPLEKKYNVHWKWWVIFISLAIFLLFLLGGSFFFHMQEKRRIEEIKASQGVADIAMALMYARVNQIKPQNQNWSNPAFLKKNLGAVLSSKYQILASLDAQGQFSNSPYLLRIYPNHDLSQFLVIAQPAPSPLQSLFPRTTIVVDSREMELRKLKDLRELNRLLVNAKTFDTFDAEASSSIIKSGEVVPLTSLTLSDNKLGFCPPRSLAILRPGAENRIYNAPRYYLFGERILNQALAFENDEYAHNAARALKQDIRELERLPNLILYSTTGFTKALHAQKALTTIAPDSQLLVGYLKLNSEGKVISSQLLMKHVLPPSPSKAWIEAETEVAVNTPEEKQEKPGATQYNHAEHGQNSKFANELAALAKNREQILLPIAEKISNLVMLQSKKPLDQFDDDFRNLVEEYDTLNAKQFEENSLQMRKLLAQHTDTPMEELLKQVDTAGLRPFVDVSAVTIQSKNSQNFQNEFKKRLTNVNRASSLESLNSSLQHIGAWLSYDNAHDLKVLIASQKQLYEAVIQKLSDFLLSPDNHLPTKELTTAHRPLLDSIFQLAWIKDEEIQSYFLREFDILSSNNN